MKRIAILTILLLVWLPAFAYAAKRTCDDDTIDEVAGDGAILTMQSGTIWKVDDVDRVDSGLWLGAEDVLVCSQTISIKGGGAANIYTIINKEEEGEEVTVTRLGHK